MMNDTPLPTPEGESQIPADVLADYTSRTVEDVKNPRWMNAGHTVLDADVKFRELAPLGYIPFTAVENADTEHGREIWQKAKAGDYGTIAEYEPPSIEEERARMPNLTARQIRLGLLSLGKLSGVQSAIDALPEPAKSEAIIEWDFASEFRRLHPLIVQLIPLLGLTDEQVDIVWEQFATV